MRDKALLKILNIEKHFEEVRVLHDFSMEADREEIV